MRTSLRCGWFQLPLATAEMGKTTMATVEMVETETTEMVETVATEAAAVEVEVEEPAAALVFR